MHTRIITLKQDEHGHDRHVHIDGMELLPGPSQQLCNHSPDGFSWGYSGSGPAQLALALCHFYLGDGQKALEVHQQFKDVVSRWPHSEQELKIAEDEVLGWFFRHSLLWQCPCGFRGNVADFRMHRLTCDHRLPWNDFPEGQV